MNKRSITSFRALFIASMKMYFRNKGAVFFTLVFPLALLAVFGFLSKGSGTKMKIDITNYSQTELSKNFVSSLENVESFKIIQTSESESSSELGKGNIDLQIILPEGFGKTGEDSKLQDSSVITHFNQAKPQNAQVANLIIGQIISGINSQVSQTPQIIKLDASGVQTNNLGFFDFILPGILGMIIMQTGLFGVAFAFVSYKASGSLRRIQATPVKPWVFITTQALSRLVVTLLTVAILIGFGIKLFNFHMLGSYWDFTLVVILGSLIFLGFGFAIAGYAKDENQVPPLANIVQLPMLLLSGIFFPRDGFPAWLKTITDYFPLTFVSDAMRHIANEGVSIAHLGHDLIGMAIWCVLVFVLAVNVFSWE